MIFSLSNIEGFHIKIFVCLAFILVFPLQLFAHYKSFATNNSPLPIVNDTQCTISYLKHSSLCIKVTGMYNTRHINYDTFKNLQIMRSNKENTIFQNYSILKFKKNTTTSNTARKIEPLFHKCLVSNFIIINN